MRAMGVIGKRGEKGGKGERDGKGGLEVIAQQTGVSRSYLCRVFKKTMGMTVGEYIREFEKEGEGFVDEVSLGIEGASMLDETYSSNAVGQCRKEGWGVHTECIGDHPPPDIAAEPHLDRDPVANPPAV